MPRPADDAARAVIILNGSFRMTPALRREVETGFVVAADGGCGRLVRHGMMPHLVVGDFDSGAPPKGIPVERHPVLKDETDGELAIARVLEAGYRVITVVGSFGGRYDMAIGHVALLRQAAGQGARAVLTDGRQAAFLVPRRRVQIGPMGQRLSIIPLGPEARLCSDGLKWPLDEVRLTWDTMRGLSNQVVAEGAWIRLAAGQALAVTSFPVSLG